MQQDIAAKALEEYNDVYAEIFNEIVFDGAAILKEEELRSLPTSALVEQIDGKVHEYFRDVRKSDQWGQEYILITAIENQAGIDCSMPVRVMGYEFSSYRDQIRQVADRNERNTGNGRLRVGQKIAPAVTVVLYWGKGTWKHPSRLYDILDFSDERQKRIQPFVNDYRIHVVAMRKLPREVRERLHGDLRGVVEFISEDQDVEERYERIQEEDVVIRHPAEFFALMESLVDGQRYAEIKARWMIGEAEIISQESDTEDVKDRKEDAKMATILDVAEAKGLEKGIEKGLRALMKKFSCSAEEAVDAFELSEQERQKFLDLLNK